MSNACSDVAFYAWRIADWRGLQHRWALRGLRIALWAPCDVTMPDSCSRCRWQCRPSSLPRGAVGGISGMRD
eukprot:10537990-Alexandrium_andersonii.AAC.1